MQNNNNLKRLPSSHIDLVRFSSPAIAAVVAHRRCNGRYFGVEGLCKPAHVYRYRFACQHGSTHSHCVRCDMPHCTSRCCCTGNRKSTFLSYLLRSGVQASRSLWERPLVQCHDAHTCRRCEWQWEVTPDLLRYHEDSAAAAIWSESSIYSRNHGVHPCLICTSGT